MILGFMWCVILRYQSALMAGETGSGGDEGGSAGAGAGAGAGAAELKRALLRWCNECLAPTGLAVGNFTSDWTDGRALLGILHTQTRGAVPGWAGSDARDARTNLEAGFAGAETLGVCRMLLVDDLARCHAHGTAPDEHAVMTYVAEVHSALARITPCGADASAAAADGADGADGGAQEDEKKEMDVDDEGNEQQQQEEQEEEGPMVVECENCKRLLAELERLRARLAEAQTGLEALAAQAEAQCDALRASAAAAVRERDAARAAAQQQQAEFAAVRDEMVGVARDIADKNEQLLRELGAARAEARALQEQAQQQGDAATAHTAQQDAELQRLRTELADAQAALARADAAAADSARACETQADETQRLRAQLTDALQRGDAAAAAHADLARENDALRARVNNQDAEIAALRAQLAAAQQQQQQQQGRAQEAAAQERAAALDRECDELHAEAARLRRANARLRGEQTRLAHSAADLRAQIEHQRSELARVQQDAADRAAAAQRAQGELQRVREANRRAAADVAELRNIVERHRAEEQVRAAASAAAAAHRRTSSATAPGQVPRAQSMRALSTRAGPSTAATTTTTTTPGLQRRAADAMSPALSRSVAATAARGRALMGSSPSKAAASGRVGKSVSMSAVRSPKKSTPASTPRKTAPTRDVNKETAQTQKKEETAQKQKQKEEEEEEEEETDLPKRVHSADATVESLTAERERLQTEVRALRAANGAASGACAELQVEIEGLRAVLAGLAAEHAAQQPEPGKEDAATRQLREAQEEGERLAAEHARLVAEMARCGLGTLLHAIARDAEPDVARAAALLDAGACAVDARDGTGATALVLACRNGHTALARVLVAHGADAALADHRGDNSVHAAVAHGCRSNSEGDNGTTLLELVCDAERGGRDAQRARNVRGDTPVAVAAARGDTAAVLALVARGADCTSADGAGATPLWHAAAHADAAMVAALLAHGAGAAGGVDAADAAGDTALHALMRSTGAREADALAVLGLLVDAGADVNARNGERVSPLQVSVLARNERMVRVIAASARVEIDAANRNGETSLYTAAWMGLDDVVRVLCQHRADPNRANNDGWRPLHAAGSKGHASTVATLLDNGADVNALSKEGHTAAFYAASAGSLATVRLLAARGADLELSAPGCWRPVHIAAFKKDEPLLRYLLAEAHVDANPVCELNKGYTPLHMCVMSPAPSPAVLKLLLDHGADINAQSSLSRNTPMHLAALMSHVFVAERLLRVPGIDLTVRNKAGKTALDVACNYCRAIVLMLCKHLGIRRIPPVHEQVRHTATTKAPVAPPKPRDVEDAARRARELARQKEEEQKQARLQEILRREQRERDHSDRA